MLSTYLLFASFWHSSLLDEVVRLSLSDSDSLSPIDSFSKGDVGVDPIPFLVPCRSKDG